MRVEPHTVGSILHVIKRGARGLPIVRDEVDKKNFRKSLFYLNDDFRDENWRINLKGVPFPERPKQWPTRNPLVDLWAWTLMSNHFHFIVRERTEGGLAKFMQRLCGSLSTYFNARHNETGSIFQGSYKARVVYDDADLRWLASYVMIKNVMELYPRGGIRGACRNFGHAWEWAIRYEFSSLKSYIANDRSPLLASEGNLLEGFVRDSATFRHEARAVLTTHMDHSEAFE